MEQRLGNTRPFMTKGEEINISTPFLPGPGDHRNPHSLKDRHSESGIPPLPRGSRPVSGSVVQPGAGRRAIAPLADWTFRVLHHSTGHHVVNCPPRASRNTPEHHRTHSAALFTRQIVNNTVDDLDDTCQRFFGVPPFFCASETCVTLAFIFFDCILCQY